MNKSPTGRLAWRQPEIQEFQSRHRMRRLGEEAPKLEILSLDLVDLEARILKTLESKRELKP